MSNLIIPKLYRTVIDNVVASVRLDFDELAVEEEILALLQQKWETKLVESRVADFERTPTSSASTSHLPNLPPAPLYHLDDQKKLKPVIPSAHALNNEAQAQQGIYSRTDDEGGSGADQVGGLGGEWNGGLKRGAAARGEIVFEGLALRLRGGAGSVKEEDDTKSPILATSTLPGTSSPDLSNENELNSDLDEEESSDDDEDLSRRNMLLCCFEKVSHQKRKWKASLRAGIAHIDGKDYVFDRATLEVVLV